MIINDYNLLDYINNNKKIYILSDNDIRSMAILNIIKLYFNNYNFIICDNNKINDYFDKYNEISTLKYFNKQYVFFIKTDNINTIMNIYKKYINKKNITNIIIFMFKCNFNILKNKIYKFININLTLLIYFKKFDNETSKYWIIQYFNFYNYNINKYKILYLCNFYKNKMNIFIKIFSQMTLFKKKTNIKINTIILRHNQKITNINIFLLSIIKKDKNKTLYIYKNIKNLTNNPIVFLNSLYNELTILHKKIKTTNINKEKNLFINFNLTLLDIYAKNNNIKIFWFEIFDIINNYIFNNYFIKEKKIYDKCNIKHFI